MSHYIEHVTINNFRSCKELSIKLSKYTPLIGCNNVGKSNILSSLEWLINDRILRKDEFYDPNEPIIINAKISGIAPEILDRLDRTTRTKIEPFVSDEKIELRREQPAEATKKSDIKLYIKDGSGDWKLNPAGISPAISKLFPSPIRVGAMENAHEDSTKSKASSTIGKLLTELSSSLEEEHKSRVEGLLTTVKSHLSSSGEDRLPELGSIDDSINKKLEDLFSGVKIKLHFEVPDFNNIFAKGTVKVIENDTDERDFDRFGHGAQRSIQIALIRHLAEIKKTSSNPSTTLLLIDEPELYLHPNAIEQVREALLQLSEIGYQILFSTHSAQMITQDIAPKALLVRKKENGTFIRPRIEDAVREVIDGSNAQAEHLFSLTQSSSVLFSDKILLSEGKTELTLLPTIFSKLKGYTLGQRNTALIQTGSVTSIIKTMEILNAMNLPTKAIVDLDFAFLNTSMIRHDDPDITKLINILRGLAESEAINVNARGLPFKGQLNVSAANAYKILAEQQEAKQYITNVKEKLKEQNIWIWETGCIEVPLGIEGKSLEHWSRFKSDLETHGLIDTCKNPDEVTGLLDWIEE